LSAPLSGIAAATRAAGLEPPAVLVVGRTAGLSAELWPDGLQRQPQRTRPAPRGVDSAVREDVFSTSLVGN
jgi:hypothetical protein